jgi:hypothetical protein
MNPHKSCRRARWLLRKFRKASFIGLQLARHVLQIYPIKLLRKPEETLSLRNTTKPYELAIRQNRLHLNCLRKLSSDATSAQRVEGFKVAPVMRF